MPHHEISDLLMGSQVTGPDWLVINEHARNDVGLMRIGDDGFDAVPGKHRGNAVFALHAASPVFREKPIQEPPISSGAIRNLVNETVLILKISENAGNAGKKEHPSCADQLCDIPGQLVVVETKFTHSYRIVLIENGNAWNLRTENLLEGMAQISAPQAAIHIRMRHENLVRDAAVCLQLFQVFRKEHGLPGGCIHLQSGEIFVVTFFNAINIAAGGSRS